MVSLTFPKMASGTQRLLTILVLFYTLLSVYGDSCTPNQSSAHPTKCTSFYMCDRDGHQHEFNCPKGLHFNRVKSCCDWPENVQCLETGNTQDLKEQEEDDRVETGLFEEMAKLGDDVSYNPEGQQSERRDHTQENKHLTEYDNENFKPKERKSSYDTLPQNENNKTNTHGNNKPSLFKTENTNNANLDAKSVPDEQYYFDTVKRQISDMQRKSEHDLQNTTINNKHHHFEADEEHSEQVEAELKNKTTTELINKTENKILELDEAISNIFRKQFNFTPSFIPYQPLAHSGYDFDDLTVFYKGEKHNSSEDQEFSESKDLEYPLILELGDGDIKTNRTEKLH